MVIHLTSFDWVAQRLAYYSWCLECILITQVGWCKRCQTAGFFFQSECHSLSVLTPTGGATSTECPRWCHEGAGCSRWGTTCCAHGTWQWSILKTKRYPFGKFVFSRTVFLEIKWSIWHLCKSSRSISDTLIWLVGNLTGRSWMPRMLPQPPRDSINCRVLEGFLMIKRQ